ncbi:MAG: hypothetical protein M5U32_07675 [Myxococcota bacterium]|nr:hypothetical protein [Myxococcota bacterium]
MSEPGTAAEADPPSYPTAQAPDRQRDVDATGLRIRVYEWG